MKQLLNLKWVAALAVPFLCLSSCVVPTAGGGSGSTGLNRNYIKNAITQYGSCHNVSLTRTNGDVMLYGKNGYAGQNCPTAMLSELKRLRNKGARLKDVQLTENGNYCILFNRNDCSWNHVPSGLRSKILEYKRKNYEVTAVAFNDRYDWVIVAKNVYACSNTALSANLRESGKKYGRLLTVCMTNECTIAVYQGGYRFIGTIPAGLKAALNSAPFDVRVVKVAGTAWFISDGSGRYKYHM